jgi:hypothetical protein
VVVVVLVLVPLPELLVAQVVEVLLQQVVAAQPIKATLVVMALVRVVIGVAAAGAALVQLALIFHPHMLAVLVVTGLFQQ